MNTANLQLEGLYLAVAAVLKTLVRKGLLDSSEVASALAAAEKTALRDPRDDELSDANRDALAFPARVLALANSMVAQAEMPSFSELARKVGTTKPQAQGDSPGHAAGAVAPHGRPPRRRARRTAYFGISGAPPPGRQSPHKS